MEIEIKGKEIELRLENGTEVRGSYYTKNNNIYLKSDKAFDLSILMKYKKEIVANF